MATSSRKTKRAMRNTITEVLKNCAEDTKILPASIDSLKQLANCLKQAGYRAAANYLAEYKLMHVEAGFAWSQQMQRTWQLCRRAVERARGPRKKAREVITFDRGEHFTAAATPSGRKQVVPLAKECFEFGVIWMLREKEIAKVSEEAIELDPLRRLVRLTWPDSKTDQEAHGVTRVLQCLCNGDKCFPSCPYRVSANLKENLRDLSLERAGDKHDKTPATKAQMVQQWKRLYGVGVTGHSARRTGALRLIRAGWCLSQVVFLGRWKSEVVFAYAAEALAALPVNNSQAFDSSPQGKGGPLQPHLEFNGGMKGEQVRDYLSTELEAFRQDQAEVLKAFKQEVVHLRDKEISNQGLIPNWVQSRTSKVTHKTLPFSYCSPPSLWQTACGWHFHQSHFLFLESEEGQLVCQKCKDHARSNEGSYSVTLSSSR